MSRPARLIWTPEMNRAFDDALQKYGLTAPPGIILYDLKDRFPMLDRKKVASRLQKWRIKKCSDDPNFGSKLKRNRPRAPKCPPQSKDRASVCNRCASVGHSEVSTDCPLYIDDSEYSISSSDESIHVMEDIAVAVLHAFVY